MIPRRTVTSRHVFKPCRLARIWHISCEHPDGGAKDCVCIALASVIRRPRSSWVLIPLGMALVLPTLGGTLVVTILTFALLGRAVGLILAASCDGRICASKA